VLVPIAERHHEYARTVLRRLEQAGLRATLDDRNEKMGYKIREAQVQKVPFMLVMGDRESAAGEVAVRTRSEGDLGPETLEKFIERIGQLIETRATRP